MGRGCGDMNGSLEGCNGAVELSNRIESGVSVLFGEIEVSPLDQRKYSAIELQNGLKVLVVSDPQSDVAAASMDVAVGHFSDPEEIPGLAHFCEHMLFLGTEKYPDEGSYRQFLAENGGDSNAYTSMENTNYHFHVVASKLLPALDRFSQFFICPLFTASATDRELKAVDSEHQKNLQSDAHRLFQLHKSTAHPLHPYHKFGTGSIETLQDTPERSVDVRSALLDFHSKYYSANLMRLCIVGPDSVDVLEKYARDLFSAVPNLERPDPVEEYRALQPFTDQELAVEYTVAPVKDMRVLELVWAVDSFRNDYKSKPAQYVAHLLGHEGKGSLLSLLKARGWADGLSAGPGRSTETFGTFDVSVELTNDGENYVGQVAELVFGYLRMIRERGVVEWAYEECRDTAGMAFRFQEREEPIELATRLSTGMKSFPVQHWLTGPVLFYEFEPEKVHKVLQQLSPEKVWMCVVSRALAEQGLTLKKDTVSTEPWYKTPYVFERISADVLERWRNAKIEDGLDMPPRNMFLPSDFSLLAQDPVRREPESSDAPIRIRSDSRWRIHFHQDHTFFRPKTNLYFEFSSPKAYVSPVQAVLTNLFTLLLVDELNEFSYDAEIAGLHYGLSNIMTGMRLIVRGYSHRLFDLVREIFQKMASYKVNHERFNLVCDQMRRDYINFFKEQPYQHALYAVSYCTELPRWHVRDYVKVAETITIEELEAFIPTLFERMYIEMLAHGNISRDEALNVAALIDELIPFKAMFAGEYPDRRVVHLPAGEAGVVYRQTGPNISDVNSAIEVYFQTGTTEHQRHDVVLELLAEVMNKPCFHQLRTIEQLGYMVFLGVDRVESSQGLRILIQSTVQPPDVLNDRIEYFLDTFRKTQLEALTDEELEGYVKSLIVVKMEPLKRLTQQTNRWWAEITDRRYQYDRHLRECKLLETLKAQDLREFFDLYVSKSGEFRRKIGSYVYGSLHPMPASVETPGALEISDPIRFRNSCSLLPSIRHIDPS
mmetsp:Transcript_6485/g.11584  ORF Transcript_6485/g.11584 Transcript_6485/m.11584 type:complete len:998 (-) Transcript_6485:512-3505(-)